MKTSEVTPEILQEWLDKYGTVHEITVDDKKAFLRKFDRMSLSLALQYSATDPIKMAETLAVNCWLAGDEEIYKDTDYIIAFGNELAVIVNGRKSDYVKHSAKPSNQ
jgi:hypothetical protein